MKYSIAVAAKKYGLVIHEITAMSNHYHIVLTDPFGRLPEFERWLNSIVARALNASYGRWENFWATEQPSYVRLVSAEDVLAKMVYTLSNPVAAGLVSHGEKWPGLDLFMPGGRKVRRPEGYFAADGALPDVVDLVIVAPSSRQPSTKCSRRPLSRSSWKHPTRFRTRTRPPLTARRLGNPLSRATRGRSRMVRPSPSRHRWRPCSSPERTRQLQSKERRIVGATWVAWVTPCPHAPHTSQPCSSPSPSRRPSSAS